MSENGLLQLLTDKKGRLVINAQMLILMIQFLLHFYAQRQEVLSFH